MTTDTRPARRERSDGMRSRRAILEAATSLATVEGLDGLSIARLADHAGISKSGLYAHFGSKEQLQLATIDAALRVHEDEIIRPALAQQDPVARLETLADRFLSYVADEVFPGGCFFASTTAEFDTRTGAVRDRLAALHAEWMRALQAMCAEVQVPPEADGSTAAADLAFEISAFLHLANDMYVLYRDPVVIERARRSIAARLTTVTPG